MRRRLPHDFPKQKETQIKTIDMKKTINLMLVAIMAFGMLACGGKKVTEDDLKKAEAALFNDDMTANPEAAPAAVETFCKYAEQNPNDTSAPDWLFKAMEIEISMGEKSADKSIEICEKLMKDYPDYKKTPLAMFMLGSMVYEDQLKDLDKARAMYERILTDYPDSEIAPSAKASIEFIGMSPEEIIRRFEAMETAKAAQEETVNP